MNYLVARVSDPEQRKALPAQKQRLEDYAKRLRWTEEKDFTYIEFDETAFKEDRKDFRKLVIERLEAESQLAIVVFDKIDRFSRDSSSEEKAALTKMWKTGKIEMHFPSDNLYINRNSPAADLFRLDIGIALAGYYSSAIRDNVKRRFDQMLNDGIWVGKAHIGYKNIDVLDENGKLIKKDIVVDDKRAPLIVEAFELRSIGVPYRLIAREMTKRGLLSNTKNPRPVVRAQWETIFTDPFYIGTMRYDGKLYKHNYKPIIEKWLWDKVQLVNQGRAKSATKYNSKPFLFKNLKCGTCGYAITFDGPKKNGVIYGKCTQYGGKHETEAVHESDLINQFRELLKAIELPKDKLPMLKREIERSYKGEQEQYVKAKKRLQKEYDALDEKLEGLFLDREQMKSHHDRGSYNYLQTIITSVLLLVILHILDRPPLTMLSFVLMTVFSDLLEF